MIRANEGEYKHILCKNPVYIEDIQGWFIDEMYNQIYEINLVSREVRYIGVFGGSRYKKGIRRLVRKCGSNLYIFPNSSRENIIVYNLVENVYQEIQIESTEKAFYIAIETWETETEMLVYFWGIHKIAVISKAELKIIQYFDFRYNVLQFRSFIEDRNMRLFLFPDYDELLQVDYKMGIIRSYNMEFFGKKIWGCFYDNGMLWINKQLTLYVYDISKAVVIASIDFPDSLIKDNKNSYDMEMWGSDNYIWYVPFYSTRLMRINKVSKEIEFLTIAFGHEISLKTMRYHTNFVLEHRYLYLYIVDMEKNIVIDMESAEYEEVKFDMYEGAYQKSIEQRGLQYGDYLYENANIGITELLKKGNLGIRQEKKQNLCCGDRIFQKLS